MSRLYEGFTGSSSFVYHLMFAFKQGNKTVIPIFYIEYYLLLVTHKYDSSEPSPNRKFLDESTDTSKTDGRKLLSQNVK